MHTASQGPVQTTGPTSAFIQTCTASLRLSESLCSDHSPLADFYRQTREMLGHPLDRSALMVIQRSLTSTLYLAEFVGAEQTELSADAIEDALADVRRMLAAPTVVLA